MENYKKARINISNHMIMVDYFKKWFTTKNNVYSLVAFIVIMLLLAGNFAYWAGAIDVMGSNVVPDNGGEEGEEVVLENYDSGEMAGTLAHGRKLYAFQPGADPRGEGEGETYNLYQFPVVSNGSEVLVVSGGDGGRPRVDGGDSNDVDLYLYSPGKEAGGNQESTQPDYAAATQSIAETLAAKKLEVGNWTLRVDCYTGSDVSYTVQIQVMYEGAEGGEGGG